MIKNLLLAIISLAFLFSLTAKVFAQSTNLLLAITEYKTREDLDLLFKESVQILEYLEGEDVEKPIFISLITESNKSAIENEGFKLKIIDNNADISRYALLYHPEPDQSDKLKEFGEVFPVSKHYTLLKSPVNKPFVPEGKAAEFFIIPFSKIIVTPPLRTKTAITSAPILTPLISQTPVKKFSVNNKLLLIFPILIFAIFIVYVLKRKVFTGNTNL